MDDWRCYDHPKSELSSLSTDWSKRRSHQDKVRRTLITKYSKQRRQRLCRRLAEVLLGLQTWPLIVTCAGGHLWGENHVRADSSANIVDHNRDVRCEVLSCTSRTSRGISLRSLLCWTSFSFRWSVLMPLHGAALIWIYRQIRGISWQSIYLITTEIVHWANATDS